MLTFYSFSSPLWADSCWPLYQAKSDEIQKEGAHTKHVGGQIMVSNGQLGYWPGIEVSGHVDDWSKDLIDAIKWGPYAFNFSSEDPRKDWLEAFKNSVDDECPAAKDFDVLRNMLKELMDDGSLCPQNKILEPKMIIGKRPFKKILITAVKDQRFPQYCQNNSISDDTTREVKDYGRSPSVIERTPLRETNPQ